LEAVNCAGEGDISVSPFSGVSAYGGTLIISGGTGGITVFDYSQETGLIMQTPRFLNQQLPNVIGHPDVVLADSSLAALSTDFSGGSSRFGTQMATIGATASFGLEYRVDNSLGFVLTLGPANFPLVNAIYRHTDGGNDDAAKTIMYTANGPMQIQDLSSSDIRVLNGAPEDFSALTVAVNEARKMVVFGGVLSLGQNQVMVYDLSNDPLNPTLVDSLQTDVGLRITSVASAGDVVAFVTQTITNAIQFLDLPQAGQPSTNDAPEGDKANQATETNMPSDAPNAFAGDAAGQTSETETPAGDKPENSSESSTATRHFFFAQSKNLISIGFLAILMSFC
jgi:hypothetical protein